MSDHTDPDTLKIPAYLRNKAITSNSRQRLLWTAWDRKEAGAPPNSKRKTGRVRAQTRAKQSAVITEDSVGQEYIPRSVSELDALHTRARLRATPHPHESPIMEVAEQKVKQLFPSNPRKYMPVGETTDYLEKINVAIILLNSTIKEGDILLIEGRGFLFTQPVSEMQIDRKPVSKAKKGSHIGLKVSYPAMKGGSVYKVL